MTDLPDRTLLAWIAGALEPGRAADVEEALRASAALRARLQLLVASGPAPTPGGPRWVVPAPGPGWGLARAAPGAQAGAWLADDLHVDEPFALLLRPREPAERRRVVVLREAEGGWEVAWPLAEAELRRLDELPAEADGARRLPLRAGPRPGAQRWVAVLVPEGAEIAWELPAGPRWQELMDALAVDPDLALHTSAWFAP